MRTPKVRQTRPFFSFLVILFENMAKAEKIKGGTPMNPSKGAKGVFGVEKRPGLFFRDESLCCSVVMFVMVDEVANKVRKQS